uniref:Vitelline envelope zona pellucida domain 5 n=1 Tax=Haliotis fulgens TaxID=6456 RepID=A0MCN9_HALFU|nr:vitelline envelope zona pellucida domain 5 [Haliotis fulgens]
MRSQVPLLVVLSCFTLVKGGDLVIDDAGGIIKVHSDCSKTKDGVTTITLCADHPVVVTFLCKGGVVATPQTQDGVRYIQTAAFLPKQGPDCLFEKMAKSEVYKLKVQVARESKVGNVGVRDAHENFLVTCRYDAEAKNSTERELIDVGQHIFEEIFKNNGRRLSNIPLQMAAVDVLGKPVKHVSLGRIVKLRATLTGSQRLIPVSCAAVNGFGEYRILLGGCGDGLVFRKTSGFRVRDRIIDSPYFAAFRLPGSMKMWFKCNYTVCPFAAKCNGNSCYNGNRKRTKRSAAAYHLQTGMEHDMPDEDKASEIVAATSPVTITPSSNRRRRATCRRDPHAFLSRRPPCRPAPPSVLMYSFGN